MRKAHGINHHFPKAASASADRKIGQLMHITAAGEATTVIGSAILALPLVDAFFFAENKPAELQVHGVASVYVEAFTGIDVGTPLTIGATGVGVKARATDGEFLLGYALQKPSVNGQNIMVSMNVLPKNVTIY